MRDAGAREFCWINPAERLALGSETWMPSMLGAFLYLMADGEAVYFPADLKPKKASKTVTAKSRLGASRGPETDVRV